MKKYIYGLGLIGMLGISIFFLPLWQIREIQIEGSHYYSETDLLKTADFKTHVHRLSLNLKKSTAKIKQLPFIKDVTIDYVFPYVIDMKVIERRPIGYIKFLDMYVCIDEEGYVLEQSQQKKLELPVIEGISSEQFVVGEKLQSDKSYEMQVLQQMIKTLNKYNFLEKVDGIQLANIDEIHLYVDRLDVIIGNIRDFDKKIKWLMEVYQHYDMGILDVSLLEAGQVVLKPMD